MECPNCRAEVPQGSNFCIHCGKALVRVCSSCGNENPPGSKFCARCGTALNPETPAGESTETAPRGAPLSAAERRHLTIVFCDLVGSTALSSRLELEDLREVMAEFRRTVTAIISRFGGYLARYMGDGVLVYFGYPQAQEDDPEQSVRAGLAVIDATRQLQGPEPLQVRVGIASGLVVVGNLIGTGAAQEREVVGEVPNLAARLQSIAEPNTIVISDSTRRLIGSTFELEDLGTQSLKGFFAPQQVWRVLGPNAAVSRFEAFHGLQTPLVGREEELALLARRWEQAKAGEGRVVLLSAEAGLGKSRLLVALQDRLRSEPHRRLRYFCSSHFRDSALFPVIAQLERAARFERGDTPEEKQRKLEALIGPFAKGPEDVALLAELLLLPSPDRERLALTHHDRKARTFEALLHQLSGLAKEHPVLVIFEDLHWSDSTVRELIERTVRCVESLPVLLIATFRPEFQHAWTGQPHVTMLSLSGLGRREGEALVSQIVGGMGGIPSDLVEEIVQRADGIPLFLEEVTKAVLENAANSSQAKGSLAGVPGSPMGVPPTLHASLMARLDRLGDAAKEIAQVAAAIGRDFSYELLALVADEPEQELQRQLTRLVEAGLVFVQGAHPNTEFQFKHALVQEVAYGTLLRRPRQRLHARISEVLEQRYPEFARSRPELLAHHFTEADLQERAVKYWRLAGELALRRSAAGEAIKHFSHALHAIDQLVQPPAEEKLNSLLGLGTALSISRGSSHPEVAETYAQAVRLGRDLGDSPQLFRALWGSWYCVHLTGETAKGLPLADELVSLAERLGDEDLMLEAYHSRWATSHTLGVNSTTLSDAERGMKLYQAARHHAHAYHYGGHDTGVCARAHGAMTLWITGCPDQAAAMADSALELGAQLGHPPSLAHAAWWSATVWQELREPKRCRELADLAIRIAQEQGSQIFVMCPLLVGWSEFELGNRDEGLRLMEQAISRSREWRRRWYFDYELLVYAEALLKARLPARAMPLVDEALHVIEASGNRLFMAEAYRLKGVALAARSAAETDEPERWLRRAFELAERQSALSFKLRAGIGMVGVLGQTDRAEEARELLASTYGAFHEGFDTADLRSADQLLGLQRVEPARGST
jgi:class 3 adenylate cyclase/tetratricopeptide (TPR) repeat protein